MKSSDNANFPYSYYNLKSANLLFISVIFNAYQLGLKRSDSKY